MKYNFRIKQNKDFDTDLVNMKCLECDYEEEVPLDILLEFFDSSVDNAPTLTCPHCDEDLFVPKDVYDQIKGNFVYKFDKDN